MLSWIKNIFQQQQQQALLPYLNNIFLLQSEETIDTKTR